LVDHLPGRKRVLVAMSGGVDSSVAALLLKESGYAVTGATMRLWVDPKAEEKAEESASGCCSYSAVLDARMVAAALDIPHHVFDMRDVFYQSIVKNFTREYLCGRTPNPCVECNRVVKFNLLRQKARVLGIEYIATGHYVRILYDPGEERFRLLRGLDRNKDQSYMLYMLGQDDLAATLFPLGEKTKEQVRELAADRGLPVADKEESQEICFIPDNDYRSFLQRLSPESFRPGDIVSVRGEKLGRHNGIAFYTVGQRKGLGITAPEPLYVIRLNAIDNQVVAGRLEELFSTGMMVEDLNFISGQPPEKPLNIEVKIRYRAPAIRAVLLTLRENVAKVVFESEQKAVTPGQSAVFYCNDEVIGGGIIKEGLVL
jgi:tRNA-uridine 2-sulfurtransferase